jgi:hypothetical protein
MRRAFLLAAKKAWPSGPMSQQASGKGVLMTRPLRSSGRASQAPIPLPVALVGSGVGVGATRVELDADLTQELLDLEEAFPCAPAER